MHALKRHGSCFCCHSTRSVIWLLPSDQPSNAVQTPFPGLPHVGICEGCFRLLEIAWRDEIQDVSASVFRAASPVTARTYVLLPRFLPEQAVVDMTAYDFVLDLDVEGDLPSLAYTNRRVHEGRVLGWLAERYGIVTWPSMFKRCYLGFNPDGLFSEVLLVQAWGRSPTYSPTLVQAGFDRLLKRVVPEAGFHLGCKAAFEMLLEMHEAQATGAPFCVFLRQAAMRYLWFKLGKDKPADSSELDLTYGLMTAVEKEIARKVLDAVAKALATSTQQSVGNPESRALPQLASNPSAVNIDAEFADGGGGGGSGDTDDRDGDYGDGSASSSERRVDGAVSVFARPKGAFLPPMRTK